MTLPNILLTPIQRRRAKDGWADNQACENSRTIVNVSAFYGEECVLENWLCVECGSLRLLHITRTRESCLEHRNNIVHSQKHVYIREPCSDLRFMSAAHHQHGHFAASQEKNTDSFPQHTLRVLSQIYDKTGS